MSCISYQNKQNVFMKMLWNCFDFLFQGVFVKKGHMRNHCCAIFGHFLVGHIDLNNGEYDSKFDNSFRFL